MTRGKRGPSGTLWAGAVAVAVLFGTTRAQAQSFAPVFVQLHAGERAYSVTPADAPRHAPHPEIASCAGDCGFWAWPGSYKLHFLVSGDLPATNATLHVRAPGDYTFVPPSVSARNTGLTLGIAGPVVALVGLIMIVLPLSEDQCDEADQTSHCSGGTRSIAYYGLATLAVGAGMTTVGWIMYGHNRARFTYRPPAAATTAPSMTARVGLMSLPRGSFGLGAALVF